MLARKSNFNPFNQLRTRISLSVALVVFVTGFSVAFTPIPALAATPGHSTALSALEPAIRGDYVLDTDGNVVPPGASYFSEVVAAQNQKFNTSVDFLPETNYHSGRSISPGVSPSAASSTLGRDLVPSSVSEASSTIPASAASYLLGLDLVPNFVFKVSAADEQTLAKPSLVLALVPARTPPYTQNLNLDIGSGFKMIVSTDSWTIVQTP